MFGGCLSPPLGRAVDLLPCGRQAIEKRAEVISGPRRGLAAAIAYGYEFLLQTTLKN